MSMLAERRFRKKYILTPRGKALYEDETRFGTKILQKMGWSKEKGLGANEDGSKDFVRVHYKNNSSGLGYENRDDQWTKHEDNFNGFLKTLNNESDSSSKKEKESASDDEAYVGFGFSSGVTSKKTEKSALKDNLSGLSLEEKSKNSKARVHYKRFTKSKDLSQYSEKDLANIFGKKANDQGSSKGDIFEQIAAAQNNIEEPPKTEENPFMVHTGVSLNDYFKQKMEARKISANVEQKLQSGELDNNTNYNEKKVKAVKHALEEVSQLDDNNETEVSTKTKNKKKKIKDEVTQVVNNELDTNVDEVVPKKKSKRHNVEENQNIVSEEILEKPSECEMQIEEQTVIKKKKKSKKHKSNENEIDLSHENTEVCDVAPSKKTQKTEIKEIDSLIEANSSMHAQEVSNIIKKKKKSKNKNTETEVEVEAEGETVIVDNSNLNTENASNNKENSSNLKVKISNKLENVEENQEELTMEKLKNLCNSYNTVNISTFVAEKFRNIEFGKFNGATLADINGYSHDENIELNVTHVPRDDVRINQLWNCSFNKYCDAKSSFYEYRKKMSKTKIKTPKIMRFDVTKFNRKNIFQGSLI